MLPNLFLTVCLAFVPPPANPATAALPSEIRDYYRNYNFVNAFSTRFERIQLASRRLASPEITDPRLRAVHERMTALADRLLRVDPGMARGMGPGPALLLTASRADLLEIRSQSVDEVAGTATVEVEALALGPEANVQLVADYPTLGENPELPRVAELAARAPLQSTGREIHRWSRVDGAWMRDAATKIFVVK